MMVVKNYRGERKNLKIDAFLQEFLCGKLWYIDCSIMIRSGIMSPGAEKHDVIFFFWKWLASYFRYFRYFQFSLWYYSVLVFAFRGELDHYVWK
jgi:hypothetical protein